MAQKGIDKNISPFTIVFFILLFIPTCYMLFALVMFLFGSFGLILIFRVRELPHWWEPSIRLLLYVTPVMCLIYLGWASVTTHLSRRERRQWIYLILLGNMLVMPIFYVAMMRRYLGKHGTTTRRDHQRLQNFLHQSGLTTHHLTSAQEQILVKYVRRLHWAQRGLLPVIIIAAFLLYGAFLGIPQFGQDFYLEIFPSDVVIMNSNAERLQESTFDIQTKQDFIEQVMRMGMMGGVLGGLIFMYVFWYLDSVRTNVHKKTLCDVLAAGEQKHSHQEETP